ncbi:MAG: hypothetical protein IT462_08115 [Planctomycetes bacterium]|nr:hypothetical protein [Planctomycetota bacterium]
MSSKRFGKKQKTETEHEKKERKAANKGPEFDKGTPGKNQPGGGAAKFFNRRTAG